MLQKGRHSSSLCLLLHSDSAVPFYERNGFKLLRKENKGETVPMYYDLTQLL